MPTPPESRRSSLPPMRLWSLGFLRRTVLATIVFLALVALTVAVYWSQVWAGRFLISGLWALVFFSLTPMIIQAWVFDSRPVRGLLLAVVKLVWMAGMVWLALQWSRSGDSPRAFGSALICGIVSPLFVVVLRAVGAISEDKRRRRQANTKSMREHEADQNE